MICLSNWYCHVITRLQRDFVDKKISLITKFHWWRNVKWDIMVTTQFNNINTSSMILLYYCLRSLNKSGDITFKLFVFIQNINLRSDSSKCKLIVFLRITFNVSFTVVGNGIRDRNWNQCIQRFKIDVLSQLRKTIMVNKLLSLRVFGLLSSSLLLFPQRFHRYVFRPSSGVCRTREPSRNFELRPLWNHGVRLFWFR